MNLLTANFEWDGNKNGIVSEKCKFNNGILNLYVERIPIHVLGKKNIFHNNKTNNICAIIGYISNLEYICNKYFIDKKDDVKVIERLYSFVGTELICNLEGVFTIFIWDEARRKGYMFQDEYGSNIPLYYANTRSQFLLSTSLKEILKQEIVNRELNLSAVRDFLVAKWIIPNKNTFVKGIYKLPPRRYIIIDGIRGSFQIKSLCYPKKKMSLVFAKTHLIAALKKSVHILHSQLKSTPHKKNVCALSAGFDSNAILFFLSKLKNNILAITIGGRERNEIANAKKLAEQYDNVMHISSVVEENKLAYFPDIVWRTEGYVCESGLFLQYELAGLLYRRGLTNIVCGECADQVLDQYRKKFSLGCFIQDFRFYRRYIIMQKVWPETFRDSKFFKYLRKPTLKINYDIELDYILKKNGIILNSYGVQGVYPFLNREIAEISNVLGRLNSDKLFFELELNKIIDKNKMKLISKAGGSTDIEYLFKGYETIISKVLEHGFFESVIDKRRMNRIKNAPIRHNELIIRLLYIFLFKKLFISRDFDSKFQDVNLDITLKDLLNDELF